MNGILCYRDIQRLRTLDKNSRVSRSPFLRPHSYLLHDARFNYRINDHLRNAKVGEETSIECNSRSRYTSVPTSINEMIESFLIIVPRERRLQSLSFVSFHGYAIYLYYRKISILSRRVGREYDLRSAWIGIETSRGRRRLTIDRSKDGGSKSFENATLSVSRSGHHDSPCVSAQKTENDQRDISSGYYDPDDPNVSRNRI